MRQPVGEQIPVDIVEGLEVVDRIPIFTQNVSIVDVANPILRRKKRKDPNWKEMQSDQTKKDYSPTFRSLEI